MAMLPPTITQQEKSITIRNGKPVVYEPCLLYTSHEGETIIRHQLFLHTKTEGLLCAFFTGIGQRKKGEKLKMNWAMVPGSRGRCRVGIREYNGKTFNEIKKFYEPVSGQPAPQPQQAQMSFEQGKF